MITAPVTKTAGGRPLPFLGSGFGSSCGAEAEATGVAAGLSSAGGVNESDVLAPAAPETSFEALRGPQPADTVCLPGSR